MAFTTTNLVISLNIFAIFWHFGWIMARWLGICFRLIKHVLKVGRKISRSLMKARVGTILFVLIMPGFVGWCYDGLVRVSLVDFQFEHIVAFLPLWGFIGLWCLSLQ